MASKQRIKNTKEELTAAESIGWFSCSGNTWLSSLSSMVFCVIFEVLDGM
jgi:hypothetical protein